MCSISTLLTSFPRKVIYHYMNAFTVIRLGRRKTQHLLIPIMSLFVFSVQVFPQKEIKTSLVKLMVESLQNEGVDIAIKKWHQLKNDTMSYFISESELVNAGNQLLRDADWAGMAHSLEIRVPLVDRRLTRFIATARVNGVTYRKRDLAGVASPPLPPEVVNRTKTGFTVPIREWMRAGTDSTRAQQRGMRGWQAEVFDAYTARASASRLT